MRLRGSTVHQLLLGGILAIAALSMIAPRIYGQLVGSPGNSFLVTDENKDFDCVRQTIECPTGGGACIPKSELIRCNDTYCNMHVGSCVPRGQTGMSSSQAMGATIPNTVTSQSSTSPEKCILTKFECKDGAQSANCFKRMRHKELNCNDRLCLNGSCTTSRLFFQTNKLEAWDLGSLEGPFPRTETMCQIRKSSCLPGDTSCLSDVTFEQTICSDPRCTTAGSCTQSQVKVDNNDNILGQTQAGTSGRDLDENEKGEEDKEGKEDEERERNHDSENNSNTPVDMNFPVFSTGETGTRTTEEPRILGCFKPDGTWTTVRTECDSDQSKYIDQRNASTLLPPALQNTTTVFTTTQEVQVREKIEQRFYSDGEREFQLNSLLTTAGDAAQQLGVLRERQELLPMEVITRVGETIEWLNQIVATFSEGTHSVNEIRQQAEDVRARIAATQTLVGSALQQSGIRIERKPETLLTKMDRIFATIPGAFSLMQEEQVPIPAEALQYFLGAQEQYKAIKPECMADTNACLKLSDVISTLEQMIVYVKDSIQKAGKPELEQRINVLLQQ